MSIACVPAIRTLTHEHSMCTHITYSNTLAERVYWHCELQHMSITCVLTIRTLTRQHSLCLTLRTLTCDWWWPWPNHQWGQPALYVTKSLQQHLPLGYCLLVPPNICCLPIIYNGLVLEVAFIKEDELNDDEVLFLKHKRLKSVSWFKPKSGIFIDWTVHITDLWVTGFLRWRVVVLR